jgi:hypothetical protein
VTWQVALEEACVYLKLPGYDLQPELRKDRSDMAIGRGLLVDVKDGLGILPVDNILAVGQCWLYCSLKFSDGQGGINFSLMYRSPNNAPETTNILADHVGR